MIHLGPNEARRGSQSAGLAGASDWRAAKRAAKEQKSQKAVEEQKSQTAKEPKTDLRRRFEGWELGRVGKMATRWRINLSSMRLFVCREPQKTQLRNCFLRSLQPVSLSLWLPLLPSTFRPLFGHFFSHTFSATLLGRLLAALLWPHIAFGLCSKRSIGSNRLTSAAGLAHCLRLRSQLGARAQTARNQTACAQTACAAPLAPTLVHWGRHKSSGSGPVEGRPIIQLEPPERTTVVGDWGVRLFRRLSLRAEPNRAQLGAI